MFTYRVRYRQMSIEIITILTITIEPLRTAGDPELTPTAVDECTIVYTLPPTTQQTERNFYDTAIT